MELTSLQFKVETKELLDAKKAIVDLGVAVGNLNKVQQDESKTAIASAKVREANAKATVAEQKASESLNKTKKDTTETTKQSTSVLERQQTILDYMTQGFSKGQSSVLAYAKASGTLESELKQLESVLQTQRKLIGGDPFDKSMSGLTALKNQYGEIREAIRQYNSDMDLTRNQTRELARDKERIIERMKLEGATFTDIKNAVRDYNKVYTEQATKVNSLIKVERDRERTSRDRANAIRNVASAEERLFSTVSHINGGMSQNATLNERAALALGSYERNLRLAGITGEAAAKKLQAFKSAQEQVTAAEAKRTQSYVARGVGVQMGDVAVSLAGGMNPFLVMVQQGDQLRGLIQQAGSDTLVLRRIMNDAALQIARSFKDVGIAVGSFVGGAITSLGRTVKDGLLAPLKLTAVAVESLFVKRELNMDIGPQISNLQLAANNAKIAMASLGVVIAGVAAVIGGSLLVSMYQVMQASNAMNKALVTQGAAMNMTIQQAEELALRLDSVGVTSAGAKAAIASFVSTGIKNQDALQQSVSAAIELQKVLGIEVEDTAKKYTELGKKPSETLIEIAKSTGLVNEETIKHIISLEKQKKYQEAADVAQGAYTAALSGMAQLAEDNLSPIERLWIDIKKATNEAWGAVQNSSQAFGIFESLQKILAAVVLKVKTITLAVSGIGLAIRAIAEGDISSVIDYLKNEAAGYQADYQKTLLDIENAKDKARKTDKAAAGERAANSEAALTIERKLKEAKSGAAKEAERELERLKELSDYYKKLASTGSDTPDYSMDYLKKKADLQTLFNSSNKSIKLSPLEFATGMDKLEKDQPWYKEYEKQVEAIKNLDLVTANYSRTLDQQQTLQVMGIEKKNADIGLTEEQRLVNEQLIKVEEDRVKNLEQINDLMAKASKVLAPDDLIKFEQRLLDLEKERYETRKRIVEDGTRQSYAQATSFEAGWSKAFASYTDAAKNSADIGKRAFEGMTNDMADALTDWAMTGKLTVRDFANTFIREIIRMQMQQVAAGAVNGLLGTVLGSVFNAFGGSANVGAGMTVANTTSTFSTPVTANPYSGMTSTPLYSEGGYTGSGGKYEPAGVVHRGEVVWSQTDVARAGGVAVVEAMRNGTKGYADGGIVNNYNRYGNTSASEEPSSIVVNVNIASDGTSSVEKDQGPSAKQLGDLVANAVRVQLIKEKRDGGFLATR